MGHGTSVGRIRVRGLTGGKCSGVDGDRLWVLSLSGPLTSALDLPHALSDWGSAAVSWLWTGHCVQRKGRLPGGIRPGVRPWLGPFIVNLFEPHSFHPDSQTVKGVLCCD